MINGLLRIIQGTLIGRNGLKVILATHSPSTVALAPDDSIHIMTPDTPGLQNVTKSYALNLLTFGLPTLSISTNKRRQVFVESEIDAAAYDNLFTALKSKLNSEISLVFIPIGKKSQQLKSDEDSGCAKVKQIVGKLEAAGNQTTFGLIDWDQHNSPNSRIKILAAGRRYSIENLLFDPILLAAFIAREFPKTKERVGLSESESYLALKNMPAERLQMIATNLETAILPVENFESPEDRVSVTYNNGTSILLRRRYLEHPGHLLETAITEIFPELQSFKREGDLKKKISQTIPLDAPELVPMDLIETFNQLLA